ncbi:putative transporter, partial [Odoribacter sp. OttesenSCG-928-J03]|nr:putative transporter [Odoribacter sp. OttesenSCG-928-J03]
MEWLYNLFMGSNVAHIILIFSIAVTGGILLGKIKVFGISLGITWILFVGIFLSHFGMRVDHHTLHFIKEFGLILFVYSVGLQVGPGFFAAFKKGGITLNMLAVLIVCLGVITTYIIYVATGLPISTMVGILSGAVTNTPGLGAAQQTFEDIKGVADPTIATGYAVAYPLGVIGIILSIISLRFLFKINMDREAEFSDNDGSKKEKLATHISLVVKNPALFDKEILDVAALIDKKFVISRVLHENGEMEIASSHIVLHENDKLLVITSNKDIEAITAFIGNSVDMSHKEWERVGNSLVSRRIMMSKSELNGKMLGNLHLREGFGVNITRVNRSGVDLVASPRLPLQMGDRLTVVGSEAAVGSVEKVLGNSLKRLREPNLVTIFLGIALGVILGSLPILIPGIPQPVKLGLAGGPLIIAILISRFGPRYGLITYTTMSANLMLREVGISLFLAAVGLGAGEGFVDTIVNGGGYMWILYGFIITTVPLFIVGIIARAVYKMNYFTLIGLLAGSMTDPPALAFSVGQAPNDMPAVAYSTVYPLTMF